MNLALEAKENNSSSKYIITLPFAFEIFSWRFLKKRQVSTRWQYFYKSLDLETIPSPPLHQGRLLRGTVSQSLVQIVESRAHLLRLLLVMCIGSGSFKEYTCAGWDQVLHIMKSPLILSASTRVTLETSHHLSQPLHRRVVNALVPTSLGYGE